MADATARFQVRYHEADRAGVAPPARFQVWFEGARDLLLEAAGAPRADLEAAGLRLATDAVTAEFFAPVGFGDELVVVAELAARSATGFTVALRASAAGRRVAAARLTHSVRDAAGDAPARPLPPALAAGLADLPSQGGGRAPVTRRDPDSVALASP